MWWWCVLDTPDHLLSLSVCRVSKPQNVGNQEGEFTPGPRHHAKGADAEGAATIYLPHSRYLLKRMSSQRVVSDVAFRPISHAGHTGGRTFPGTLRTRRARARASVSTGRQIAISASAGASRRLALAGVGRPSTVRQFIR